MYAYKYYVLFFTCFCFLGGPLSYGQVQTKTGRVINHATGATLSGVNIRSLVAGGLAETDKSGNFTVKVNSIDTLRITAVGYAVRLVVVNAASGNLLIELHELVNELQEVQIVNTGYQSLPKERATGSFDFIGHDLFNRAVSPNVLSRMENLTPGLLFNHGDAAGTDAFLIRGRSTITADAQPLIVLDNFPYDGDLNSINPNDIERIFLCSKTPRQLLSGGQGQGTGSL